MIPKMQQLEQHLLDGDLVSIYRTGIDDHQIQGFVLAASPALVLLQYVYDFRLDGLMALRIEDITQIEVTATDRLQKQLITDEGLAHQSPLTEQFNAVSWRELISSLSPANSLMILECEAGEFNDFVIGKICQINGESLQIRTFSGTGEWADVTTELHYEDITCCQVGTNYANVYQRYFERLASNQN
ncbi:hypothetical protein VLK31_28065 [Variovorax sp. H27-G14]